MKRTIAQLTLSIIGMLCAGLALLVVAYGGDSGWWYIFISLGATALLARNIIKRGGDE